MIGRASYSVMRIERAALCDECPPGTPPHFLTRRITWVSLLYGFRVSEDLCAARYHSHTEALLDHDDVLADLPDEVLERFAGMQMHAMRERIAQLERDNASLTKAEQHRRDDVVAAGRLAALARVLRG